jgi:AcrR family transcriptional regulator
MSAIAAKGLDVTVDDMAEAAMVSRRTVFRHFATHTAVLVAAIAEILRVYDANMPAPPAPGTDVDAWLSDSAVAIHELNRRVLGRAFWDAHVERPGIAPEVTAAIGLLRHARDRYADDLATGAWQALGAQGTPPHWVVDAFILQLSGFATNAMDGHSTEQAGRVSALVLSAVLAAALAGPGKAERRD